MEIKNNNNFNSFESLNLNSENSGSLIQNKHSLYQKSVQNPKREVEFFRKTFRMVFKILPESFREDFCGTGLLSCEWVKNNVCNTAVGLDLDEETIKWGIENNVNNLSSQSDRILLITQNVLDPYNKDQKFDIICSMNYSHFLLIKEKTSYIISPM